MINGYKQWLVYFPSMHVSNANTHLHTHLHVADISMVTPIKGSLLSLYRVIDSLGTRGELWVSATTAPSLSFPSSSCWSCISPTAALISLSLLYQVYISHIYEFCLSNNVTNFHWLQGDKCHHTAVIIRSLLRRPEGCATLLHVRKLWARL